MKISSPGLSLTTVAPTTSAFGDAAAVGTALLAARGDHRHGREAVPMPTPGRLAADQAFTSNTTYANLTGMSQTLAANEEAVLLLAVTWTGNTGGGKVQITLDQAVTSIGIHTLGVDGAAAAQGSLVEAGSVTIASSGVGGTVLALLHIRNGANALTVQVQGAQQTSSGTASNFQANSGIAKVRAAA